MERDHRKVCDVLGWIVTCACRTCAGKYLSFLKKYSNIDIFKIEK